MNEQISTKNNGVNISLGQGQISPGKRLFKTTARLSLSAGLGLSLLAACLLLLLLVTLGRPQTAEASHPGGLQIYPTGLPAPNHRHPGFGA